MAEARVARRVSFEHFHVADVASFPEAIRIALDDLIDALYPAHSAGCAWTWSAAQFRQLEAEVEAAQKLRRQVQAGGA
jgi:hypothetical protein